MKFLRSSLGFGQRSTRINGTDSSTNENLSTGLEKQNTFQVEILTQKPIRLIYTQTQDFRQNNLIAFEWLLYSRKLYSLNHGEKVMEGTNIFRKLLKTRDQWRIFWLPPTSMPAKTPSTDLMVQKYPCTYLYEQSFRLLQGHAGP